MKKQIQIVDFNSCQYSRRHATYGGQAGLKEGIIFDNANWLVKYPKSTAGMKNMENLSYTTAPLSEYLGSHIYDILGYDVHETRLGIRNNTLVVACKDFCTNGLTLFELRVLKNVYNKEMALAYETSFFSTRDHVVDLDEVLMLLEVNPILKHVEGIKERFWNCVVVDGFINNNDRNYGNWGILRDENGMDSLAPIYDNGASFSNKLSDEQIAKRMEHEDRIEQSVLGVDTGYSKEDKLYKFGRVLQIDNEDLKDAIVRNTKRIEEKMDEIKQFIHDIPATHQGLSVMSPIRKEFYIRSMEIRLEKMLEPRVQEIILERESKCTKE